MAAPTRAPPAATSGRPSVVRRYRPLGASQLNVTRDAGHAVVTDRPCVPPGPAGPNRNPGSLAVGPVPARAMQGLGVADDVVGRSAVTGAAVPLGRGVVGDRGEVGLVDDPPRERGPAGEGEGHPAPAGQQGDVGLAGAADGPDLGRQVARAGREDRQETREAALDRLDVDDSGLVDPDARPSTGRVVDLDGEDGAVREAREGRRSSGRGGAVVVVVEVVVVGEGASATAVVGPAVRRCGGEEQAASSRATVATAPSGQRTRLAVGPLRTRQPAVSWLGHGPRA